MMKTFHHISFLTAFALLAAFASCTREPEPGADGPAQKKVAYIALSAESGASGVKSSLGADYKVSWEAGDDILYYTGSYAAGAPNTAMTENGSYKVPASGDAVSLPVEYRDGDNRVTILTKGRSVGAVISPATLNSITVEDAVPASQTGTFASCYLAAAEGNLLELAAGTGNVSLTRLQSYIRFKLSSLTVGDRTVNRIEITGTSTAGADKICGDLTLGITEDASHTVTAAPSAAPDALGTTITIDRTASKFNADEYIYAALLPYEYTQLTFTLYSGATKVASVPVIRSGGTIDATQGRLVDIGEVNSHAKIAFVSAKMYPERVAITAERSTKYLWLKVEPSDFNGTVTWESSNTSYATVESVGTLVDEPGIGRCIKVAVTNQKTITSGSQYNLGADYVVNIKATITDPSDGQSYSRTCQITIGDFLDLGIRNSEGKRILFARQILYSDRTNTSNITYQLYQYEETRTPNDYSKGADNLTQSYVLYGWGEIYSTTRLFGDPMHFAWNTTTAGENANATTGEYSKYKLSLHLPHLQRYKGEFVSEGIPLNSTYDTVDDVAARWNSDCHTPSLTDMGAFINGTKKNPVAPLEDGELITYYYITNGTAPGYTDTYLCITNRARAEGERPWNGNFGWWTCEDEVEYTGNAFYFDGITYSILSKNKYRRAYVRPVKYVD